MLNAKVMNVFNSVLFMVRALIKIFQNLFCNSTGVSTEHEKSLIMIEFQQFQITKQFFKMAELYSNCAHQSKLMHALTY